LSATPGSLIVACHGLCIPSFIGWTFLNESTTNSVCSCADASTTKLLGTWWTTVHQYPTLPIVNGYVLPVVMKSLFHGTGSVPMLWMDVGHLPLLADCLELCLMACGVRRFLRTVTGSHWRRLYFRRVSEQCFTSPPRLYGRQFLQVKKPNQQYQSTEGRCTRQRKQRKQLNTDIRTIRYDTIGEFNVDSKAE